ncbi:YALIA101S04e12222g1_1 [Yarrowia lipolytica]|jgi:ubiquitin carboxyl-terminal hydrolase 16|nr:Ubiquitin carboxyl-terminal hydrolase 16 [Yarrowia lipolytica]SEI34167.1 YALIA101S04e12222g1_1 [Yarrowia lipolytica]
MPPGLTTSHLQDWLSSVSNSFLASYSQLDEDLAVVSSSVATVAQPHWWSVLYAQVVAFLHKHLLPQHRPSISTLITTTATTSLCIYIFAPSLLPDRMFSVFSSRSKRPGRYTVGLVNLANDCFANSNLQALASLRSLLLYIDEAMLVGIPQENLLNNSRKNNYPVDAKGKQYLRLTRALGSMIMELNEPVKNPKTVSPWKFLVILEQIYNSRISRNQHDAHELLHLILECLSNEYEAAVKDGILRPGQHSSDRESVASSSIPEADIGTDFLPPAAPTPQSAVTDPEMLASFPFEGSTIDRIACSRCGYLPPVQSTNFLVLSLMVPQKRHASLTDLIDRMTAPEYIKDYGCVSCRLKAVSSNPSAFIGTGINGSKARYTPELVEQLSSYSAKIDQLPEELEEALPKNITSPISKSTRFSKLPLILSLHLSRSIYSGDNASRNSCKVSCPEFIDLYESNPNVRSREDSPGEEGDALASGLKSLKAKKRVKYRLVAMIRHNGTHYTGHYECYRRKNLTWWKGCIQRYSKRAGGDKNGMEKEGGVAVPRSGSEPPEISVDTTIPSPSLSASQPSPVSKAAASTSSTSYVTHSNSSSYSDLKGLDTGTTENTSPDEADEGEESQLVESLYSTLVLNNGNSTGGPNVGKYEWWRISDDSIWECHTKDVLKEESGAYLLFYEQCIES